MELYPGCFRQGLSNAITVIGEEVPHSKSISLGVWFNSGSRDEAGDSNGITHLIEHLLFRGTDNRSAYQITSDVDRLGGLINGSTSTEFLLLSLQLLPEALADGVEILTDLVNYPLFDREDMQLEKGVVLEEIRSSRDDNQSEAIRLFEEAVWGKDCGLSRPVLGTEGSVKSISRSDVFRRFSQLRQPRHLTVTAAGKLDFDKLTEEIGAKFDGFREDLQSEEKSGVIDQPQGCEFEGKVNHDSRDIRQLHTVIGVEGIPRSDERRYPLEMLNVLLGHGMSSRLFQKVRKERGLAYHVLSNTRYYSDTGLFYVYGAIDPDNLTEYKELVLGELENLRLEYVTDEELELAKQKTKGNLVLGLENNEALMGRLGISALYNTDFLSISSILEKIDSVSKEEIKNVVKDLFSNTKIKYSLLGPGTDNLSDKFS